MPRLIVKATALNVRAAPSTTSPVLLVLPQGTMVEAVPRGLRDGWRRIDAPTVDGPVRGWVAERFLAPAETPMPIAAAPWMAVATREIGVREFPGPSDNPRVVEYERAAELDARGDDVPWCSCFVNWCMGQVQLPGTRSAAARSWLAWGRQLDAPQPGCVAVLRRGADPARGHVGFYLRTVGERVELLGGNQGNAVSVSRYATADVLGWRWAP